MKNGFLRLAAVLLASGFCAVAQAQSSYVLESEVTGEVHTFTNSLGTAVLTNGMVVFSGELRTEMFLPAATNEVSGFVTASVQLLTQVKLFDELPSSNEVGNVQGAVAAKKMNPPDGTVGQYFVWGSTNNVPLAWVPLLQANTVTPFQVDDGATNYLTFVFNYPTNSADVTYQVFVGNANDTVMAPSDPVTSPTNAAAVITGVSLLGTGGLAELSSTNGVTTPLSTQVGFSVYDTASGIYMVIDTVNESGSGLIKVFAWINGGWRQVGEVMANGSNHYEFYAFPGSGLAAGNTYKFRIVDEAGNTHDYNNGLTITATRMDSVTFELNTMVITFNTVANHNYLVLVADSPAAPAAQWTAQFVQNNAAGDWSAFSDQPFTATGPNTSIKIPVSSDKKKAFFKVLMND